MVKGQSQKKHNYGYGSTTKNRRLCIITMVRGHSHKTHGYGSTTKNPRLWVSHKKPTIRGQPHKTHSYGLAAQNPRLWVNRTKPTVIVMVIG